MLSCNAKPLSMPFYGNISDELEKTSHLQNELVSVREALDAYSSSTDGNNNDVSRQIKSSKKDRSSKSSKASGELNECKAELAKYKKPKVSFLFIQTAPSCQVQRSTNGNGKTSYKLLTDAISEVTYIFSDRPYRLEMTSSTSDFSDRWSEIFKTLNPNTAVTFVSEDNNQMVEPIVVVFSEPDYQGNGQLAYDIDQSPNQDKVLSIESIFDGSTSDSVSFESCSYFIDSSEWVMPTIQIMQENQLFDETGVYNL